jgi:hypothetical protein
MYDYIFGDHEARMDTQNPNADDVSPGFLTAQQYSNCTGISVARELLLDVGAANG